MVNTKGGKMLIGLSNWPSSLVCILELGNDFNLIRYPLNFFTSSYIISVTMNVRLIMYEVKKYYQITSKLILPCTVWH